MQPIQVSSLLLASIFSLSMGQSTAAEEGAEIPAEISTIAPSQVQSFESASTTVNEWMTQLKQASSKEAANADRIQVTGVTIAPTDEGLEITLATVDDRPLAIDASQFRAEGNALVAEIANAVLALAEGPEFSVDNPTDAIANVRVVQLEGDRIQVTVTGQDAPPTLEVTLKTGAFAYVLNPDAASADEEVVVTGEQPGSAYFVPEASTATRTETPLRDIPQSIQVIPRQLLDDRNTTDLRDALETLSGVSLAGGRGSSAFGENILIRGFNIRGEAIRRDGIPFFSLGTINTTDIERIEVLRGPASVLFGAGEPGGIINLVSKQPLAEPYYAFSFTGGSFNTYRGAVDLSGPLNESQTVRYRLNAAYESYHSFRNFVYGERFSITPTLAWDISPNTSFNLFGQFITERETIDEGLAETSQGVVDIPRDRFLNEPFGKLEQDQFNIGYTLNHRLSEDWSLRHALQYLQYDPLRYSPLFDTFDEATGDLSRFEYAAAGTYRRFFTNADIIGKFKTGSIQHQLLFGVEYRYLTENPSFQFSNTYPSINVFNPVYARRQYAIVPEFFRDDNVSVISTYLQDQIELLPNLKLLAGIRYDSARQFRTTREVGQPRNEFEQTDDAWSPRIGIVYQPIRPLSIYASYARSFAPSFAASRNDDGSTFEPETGQQFEVGIKADISDSLSLTLAAFDLQRQNLATPDPDNPAFSLQVGEQTSRGIEFNLAGEVLPGWNMTASYAYLDAFVSEDNTTPVGNRLPDVPEHQFSLWTTYTIQKGDFKGLGLGLGLFYVGERQRDLDNTYTLPSYFRTDAALFYQRDNWRAQVNIENLFDVDYLRSGNYSFVGSGVNPGKPFNISASLTVEF